MIDTRTQEVIGAKSVEELHAKIPPSRRGPTFKLGENLEIRGKKFKLAHVDKDRLVFAAYSVVLIGSFTVGEEVEWKEYRWEVEGYDTDYIALKPRGRLPSKPKEKPANRAEKRRKDRAAAKRRKKRGY